MMVFKKLLILRTPEGIRMPLEIAAPITRLFALVLDFMVVQALAGLGSLVFRQLRLLDPDLAAGLWMVLSFVLTLCYPMILEWFWHGQTVGKRLMGLRVLDCQGLRLIPSQVIIRNLLRVIDVLPGFYLVGGVASFLSRAGQRLGDLAANTIVVQHRRVLKAPTDLGEAGKFNSLREHPALVARLRQKVPAEAVAVLVQALARREEFEPAARLTLFAELRDYLAGIVAFPQEVADGLSAEQYVRNAVDVLLTVTAMADGRRGG